MKTEILFSIVIPTYNRANLIEKTLQTVFDQQYNNYEVIVVDNCSTDNTREVLQPYIKSGKIRFIRHDKNYERSKSRNTGMQNATGDYLTFLDSDDFLYPDSLQVAYEYIKTYPHTKIFHHYYELVQPNGQCIYSFPFPHANGRMLKQILAGNFLSCIGVFISRDIYQVDRFDETPEAIGSEDWDFWIRILSRHQLGTIQKVCAGIVDHSGRTVSAQDYKTILQRKDYYLDKYRAAKDLSIDLKQNLHIFEAGFYQYAATIAFQSQEKRVGYKLLGKALKLYPTSLFHSNFWRVSLNPLKQLLIK